MTIATGKTVNIRYFPNGKQDKKNFKIVAQAKIMKIRKNKDNKVDYHLETIKIHVRDEYIPDGFVPDVVNNHDKFWSVVNPYTFDAKNKFCQC